MQCVVYSTLFHSGGPFFNSSIPFHLCLSTLLPVSSSFAESLVGLPTIRGYGQVNRCSLPSSTVTLSSPPASHPTSTPLVALVNSWAHFLFFLFSIVHACNIHLPSFPLTLPPTGATWPGLLLRLQASSLLLLSSLHFSLLSAPPAAVVSFLSNATPLSGSSP